MGSEPAGGAVGTLGVTGLTAAEVAEREARGQVNDVPRRSSRSFGEIVRANVLTRFNALIGSLFVLILAFGVWQDALFGVIIFINSGIGVVQEWRAKRTLDRLAVVGQEPVRVVRDGVTARIPPEEIVLDDVILVGSGDRIVVDGVALRVDGLEIDESLLTGEADPVHKQPGDKVLSGSFAVAGAGAFTATKVGRAAYAAQLAEEASRFTLAHSELQAGINRFLTYVTWILIPTATLLVISQLAAHQSLSSAVTGMVAGTVTMIPEGLVLLTSIAFALGVIRLGRRRCLVQELPAIEVLARVDVLCLDKTGTLTDAGMDLDDVRPLRPGRPVRAPLAALAGLEDRPSPTLTAIIAGLPPAPAVRVRVRVPFSSARKWSGAVFEPDGESDTDWSRGWVLGAPDVLLPAGHPVREQAEQVAGGGLRVLLLGQADPAALARPEELATVEPAALVILRQRIRPEAARALAYFAEQGVALKVVSGDNAASVGAVAAEVGVPGAEHPVDARELPDSLDELAEALERNSVFGRVTPEQKRRFVAALKSRGHVVAMTGDGVNDVLALKDADLGVAMGAGSGATRAVAKVVLLDNNFATLPHVVAEGRRVLGNIERVANLFLTKTVYSILLAVLVGLVHVPFPFLPRHLTLISSLTIGIPAFFLALAPNLERARPGFVPRVLRFAIPAGLVCAASTFAGYYLAIENPGSGVYQDRVTATVSLFLVTVWVLLLIAAPHTPLRLALVAAMVATFLLVLEVPITREFFALDSANARNDGIGLLIAAAGAALLTLGLRASATFPWRPPVDEPRPERVSRR